MKKTSICLFLVSVLNANAIGEISPIKEFSPPNIIKPFDYARLENQFDLTNRTYLDDELLKTFSFTSALFHNSTYNKVLLRHKDAKYYTILNATNTKANSYKDPSGNNVDFGYKRLSLNAIAGFTPNEFSDTKIAYIRDDLQDDKQPQFVMDPVKTLRNIYMLNQRIGDNDLSNTLNLNLKYITLERHANNYDLRPSKAKMRMKIDRKILVPSFSYDIDFSNFHSSFGFIYTKDKHEAKRYANEILNAYKYPDIRTGEYEFYAKNKLKINEENSLDFDLGYLINKAKANKQNIKLANPSGMPLVFPNSNSLWKMYYGKEFNDIEHKAFSFNFAYNYDDNLNSFSLAAKRLARVATNLERFTSIFASNPRGFQVSNPFLNPEYHNIVELSFSTKNEAYKGYLNSLFENGYFLETKLSFDNVKDLIIFDRAKSGAIISKNVDANIFNAKLNANYNFLNNFGTKIGISYTHAQNKTDKTPLYQIKPLELTSNIDYKDYFAYGTYQIGAAYRYSFKQTRINESLGIDKDLGGFGVLDLYSNIKIKDSFSISFGVFNVLNKQYAEFISPSHVESFEYRVINAPSRSFYLKLNTTF